MKPGFLIDSHCHLNLNEVATKTLLDAATAQNIAYFLNVAVDQKTLPEIIATAQQFEPVYASAGIHPNSDAGVVQTTEELLRWADANKVIAMGETGLDYFRSEGDLAWQQQRFRNHIRAAKDNGKPLIIHCREAAPDVLRILQEEKAETVGGIMHCFVEDWETAQATLDLGFYISFSGIVTFKNAKALQAVAQKIPLDSMLVETDSPYLAPVPHRGKNNQPAYVRDIANFIATLRETDLETIATATSQNFLNLFPDVASVKHASL